MSTDARALLRAAAAASQARVEHPAAAYAADGALSCRVCQCRLPGGAAAWPAHTASRAHAQQRARVSGHLQRVRVLRELATAS